MAVVKLRCLWECMRLVPFTLTLTVAFDLPFMFKLFNYKEMRKISRQINLQ